MVKQAAITSTALLMLLAGGILLMQWYTSDKMVHHEPGKRWYSDQQVTQGGKIFQTHCAGCHGPEAASTPHWRKIDENGHYPPPPLNGTAHTWHHSLAQLRNSVRNGGIPLGGQMPPFKDLLTDHEIDAVLAWVQNHWTDEIYQRWLQRNAPA